MAKKIKEFKSKANNDNTVGKQRAAWGENTSEKEIEELSRIVGPRIVKTKTLDELREEK